jgi:PAS domain S-box-containing protein
MNQSGKRGSEHDSLAFLAGGGEMGERIRTFDWSQTSLGPLERWPQSLRSAVSILLPSKAQIVLFWGRELITLYNDAYRPVFGAKHPRALGLPVHESWSELWVAVLKELFEGVLATGEAYWASDRPFFLERFGYSEETFFDVSYDPVRDEIGQVGGVFCIVSETTARVVGERRLKTLRELSARTTEEAKSAEEACQVAARILADNQYDLPFALIYLLDAEAKNARLAGSAGLAGGSPGAPCRVDLTAPGGERAGWPLRTVLKADRAEVVTELGQLFGALPGGVWPESPHTAVVLPIRASGQERLAGFLVAGISPRRPLDDHYRGFFDLLANQTATAIANARAYEEERRRAEALAELDRAKTAFFSNVSHEFRTPLTMILGPLEDFLAETKERWQRDRLELMHRNALRLQKLVNALLDFSRIEAGRIKASFEPTHLATLTTELVSVFRSAVEKAGLRLIVHCPPLSEPVYVDRDMYEKVVLNLLSNAFKFTLEGEIEVQLRETGAAVQLSVRDTGTGITEGQLPHIFERFHRIEGTRARTHEGTGIGLALVEELVKLHGGTVNVQSVEAQGSTFTITIPKGKAHLPADRIAAPRQLASTALAAGHYLEEALRWLPEGASALALTDSAVMADVRRAPADGRRPRIVWADDNADMRDYVGRLLGPLYDMEAVADGEAALAAVKRDPPDLVLADVMMPRLDGFGLLQALRSDERTRTIPIILLSARAGEEARVEGLQAGADDYLIKPFSARELLARVGAHLEMARLRRAGEERVRGILENLTDGFQSIDANWRYTYVNPAVKRMFAEQGINGEAMIGRHIFEVFPEVRDSELGRAFIRCMTERVAVETESFYPPFQRWYSSRHFPAIDGGVSIFVQDITERKRGEQELRKSDRRKNEFLAMLAHELRNPLAPIRNALEILRLTGGSREAVQSASEMIDRQIGQMVRLVDELLDVSRISRGKIELRRGPVELASVVNHAAEAARPLLESKGLNFTVTLPPQPVYLHADPVRLVQVVGNLLNNACKFTDKGGSIWLTAEVVASGEKRDEKEESGDGGAKLSATQGTGDPGSEGLRLVSPHSPLVTIRVRDTGIGIAADQLPRVFDMFMQVNTSLERTQGGLGIGLTLAKTLVELHGGTLGVHSSGPGQGSEFVVRLPLASNEWRVTSDENKEAAGDVLAPHPSPLAAKRRILVVDDNEDSAESLTVLLKLSGNETQTAYDGLEAVEAAATFRPDVILLDIGLPELNGYEVARKIREQPWGKKMALVALTGWGQEEDRRRSQEAGFNHHLTKPVDPAALTKLLVSLSVA